MNVDALIESMAPDDRALLERHALRFMAETANILNGMRRSFVDVNGLGFEDVAAVAQIAAVRAYGNALEDALRASMIGSGAAPETLARWESLVRDAIVVVAAGQVGAMVPRARGPRS